MARLNARRVGAALCIAVGLVGCDKLVGFGGPPTPLANIQVLATGDEASAASHLQVALVWGAEWVPEPFCFLPPDSPAAATVIAAGCPDSFGFVPQLVAASVPVELGVPATIQLFDLPSADVMVGDVTARVAYASLVLYDDTNRSGTLELRNSQPTIAPDLDGGVEDVDGGPVGVPPFGGGGGRSDVVYGASFVSMTAPDVRIAYREGAFVTTAFYPRSGCAGPPSGFSILGAGGFPAGAAIAAARAGPLPMEDPQTCTESSLADGVVTIVAQAPSAVTQIACVERTDSGITRYRKPPANPPNLDNAVWACAHLPDLNVFTGNGNATDAGPTTTNDPEQLVIASPPTNACKSLTHYILRGCNNNPDCATPSWDQTATPPSWWPCPIGTP